MPRKQTNLLRQILSEAVGVCFETMQTFHRLGEQGHFAVAPDAAVVRQMLCGEPEGPQPATEDDVRAFIEECCERRPGGVATSDLFSSWSEWSQSRGLVPSTDAEFGRLLVKVGSNGMRPIKRKRLRSNGKLVYFYFGICFKGTWSHKSRSVDPPSKPKPDAD